MTPSYIASGRMIRAMNAPRGGFNLSPEAAREVEHIFTRELGKAAADGDTAAVTQFAALILDMNEAIEAAQTKEKAA